MAKQLSVLRCSVVGNSFNNVAVDRDGNPTPGGALRYYDAKEARAIAAKLNDARDSGSEDSDETGIVSYVAM